MREQGEEQLDDTVREKLRRALTPSKPDRLGCIFMSLHGKDEEEVKPLMYLQPPSHTRRFRVQAPAQPADETLAAVDLLLQCCYWKAAVEMRGREGGEGGGESLVRSDSGCAELL